MTFDELVASRAIERVTMESGEIAELLRVARRDITTASSLVNTSQRLQRFRKKRNATVYEQTGLVGEAEARDIIAFAAEYVVAITQQMPAEVTRELPED